MLVQFQTALALLLMASKVNPQTFSFIVQDGQISQSASLLASPRGFPGALFGLPSFAELQKRPVGRPASIATHYPVSATYQNYRPLGARFLPLSASNYGQLTAAPPSRASAVRVAPVQRSEERPTLYREDTMVGNYLHKRKTPEIKNFL